MLLFVFWYCHKRGRQIRLEKERDLTEHEVEQLDEEYRAAHPDKVLTTTADPGASAEDVKAGIEEAQEAKNAATETKDEAAATPPDTSAKPGTTTNTAETV